MERRQLTREIHALVSRELEGSGFLAVFSERTGGSSKDAFSSLNLGRETGDDPVLVAENRERLSLALGLNDPISLRQVHGDRIVEVPDAASGRGDLGEGDGLTTSSPSVPLAVMVADCVPLALASERDGRVAAVHVGWRGLASGIAQRAVHSFSVPSDAIAAIGPSIGPCHYEVGEEVVSAVREGTSGVAIHRGRPFMLDLAGTIEAVLRREGVRVVDRASECTACEADRFFSHRRDGRGGRQALVAVRL